jgi:hypothetical protein
MALKAGTKDPGAAGAYENSMAEAIEQAFLDEWRFVMKDQPPPKQTDQMKLLFVAVARGVVAHLAAHPEAFKYGFSTSSLTVNGQLNKIETI